MFSPKKITLKINLLILNTFSYEFNYIYNLLNNISLARISRNYTFFSKLILWLFRAEKRYFDFFKKLFAKLLEIITVQNRPIAHMLILSKLIFIYKVNYVMN